MERAGAWLSLRLPPMLSNDASASRMQVTSAVGQELPMANDGSPAIQLSAGRAPPSVPTSDCSRK